VASILGLITLFIGASGVFAELRDSLNRIWDVPSKESSGVVSMIRQRFLSFGMVLAIGFLLLVSLIIRLRWRPWENSSAGSYQFLRSSSKG
jgi:membrane protein